MKNFLFILALCSLSSCYKTLKIGGFDTPQWQSAPRQCDDYRLSSVDLLLERRAVILESTQNEVESLLGAPDEHELHSRNQKFFHYRLTSPDSCGSAQDTLKFLSIRFNALGLASDVQVMIRERNQ